MADSYLLLCGDTIGQFSIMKIREREETNFCQLYRSTFMYKCKKRDNQITLAAHFQLLLLTNARFEILREGGSYLDVLQMTRLIRCSSR